MGDEAKSGDTTKILPIRMSHIMVFPGPCLLCRTCGVRETMEMPLLANQAIHIIRDFVAEHAKCTPKVS